MREEYRPGAQNAVRACLGINSSDRVAIIRDLERAQIADAVEEEARSTGAEIRCWVMEESGERPLLEMPARMASELTDFGPTASFYIGGSLPGELGFRKPMRELLVDRLKVRHGHMVGITHEVMVDGMAGDYEAIYELTRRIYDIVRSAARIKVAGPLGTELSVTFSTDRRWIPSDGRYQEPGRWGNLPEGEVFTAPRSIDGWLVGEELGDYFSERYGLLDSPARIRIRESRAVSVEVQGRTDVEADLRGYLDRHPCSTRVGEFAIGTNLGLTRIIGNFLQDEKFPGVHVAFGDPYGHETGADWECPTHVDVLTTRPTIEVDGRAIMEDGRFLV